MSTKTKRRENDGQTTIERHRAVRSTHHLIEGLTAIEIMLASLLDALHRTHPDAITHCMRSIEHILQTEHLTAGMRSHLNRLRTLCDRRGRSHH